jgi:hypothetical protein
MNSIPHNLVPQSEPFASDEDSLFSKLVFAPVLFTWIGIASRIPGPCGRQCPDRWVNYLCRQNKFAPWTKSEDYLLVEKVLELGSCLSRIAGIRGSGRKMAASIPD